MTPLAQYGINLQLGELPKVVQNILPHMGLQEVIGRGSHKTIIEWRDELNQAYGRDKNAQKIVGYSDDDIPWCGLFQAYVWFKAGKAVVASPLWARNWAKAGDPIGERIGNRMTFFKDKKASLGDTLVFARAGGGGHVGTYICEDQSHYAVAGGNQANSVSIMRLEKARCIAIRRPPMLNPPKSVRPFVVSRVPAKTSVNEA